MTSGPPAHAWDWLARQRLPWREVHRRLVGATGWAGRHRYGAVDARKDVLSLLRADYPDDDTVRATVDAVVTELAFLGRMDRSLADLGVVNPPRGLRWWWEHLTGEAVAGSAAPTSLPVEQLTLALHDLPGEDLARVHDVHGGYGDPRPSSPRPDVG